MTVVENIFGIVLIILVISVVAIMAFFSVTKVFMGGSEITQTSFELDRQNDNLDTILNIEDNSSGIIFNNLLSEALIKNSYEINLDGQTINVKNSFEKLLNIVYGDDYFVKVMPVISDVRFSFILDGSNSFSDERVMISDIIDDVYDNVKSVPEFKDINITFSIYLLNVNNPEAECELFNITGYDITCKNLASYNLRYLITTFWPINHNSVNNIMLKSAWLSGAKFASDNFKSIVDETIWTNKLHLITILADEPSTSAFPTRCFDYEGNILAICGLCEAGCNGRENPKVDYDYILQNFFTSYDRFIGLYAFNCNYDYASYANTWNQVTEHSVITNYSDTGKNPLESNIDSWCDFDNCTGCEHQINNQGQSEYCFRPACKEILLQQMNNLTTRTGGSIIDINDVANLGETLSQEAINIIEHESLIFGEPFNHTFVVKKKIFLKDNKITNIYVYS